ncbi:prtrc system protein e [Chitinophaga japonensis]|uniref:PRTRC genetic system protein E n=1 Tax=Chitinophaga japonensis TaxID=104662 RepID=A0A562T3G2_CHIJA|nr:prtrc system protein e [Chitinophaga japonensis]TWI87814.1 PRTRC genetic system protein E [Chitinophaga japonensis]
MESTFFKQLAALEAKGSWTIQLDNSTDEIIMSVLFRRKPCGDRAVKIIPAFNLNGTPETLDQLFFDTIRKPFAANNELQTDMEHYLKQMEEARKQSAMEKEKAAAEAKAKEEKKKRYEAAMKTVDELAKEGKYREAWMKCPDPNDFPDHAESIRKRRTELSEKFAPELF